MSVASAPNVAPYSPPPGRPEVVQPQPKKPSNAGIWGAVCIALLMVAAAIWWQRRSPQNPGPAPSLAAIRTAKVTSGAIVSTIRITGVTSALNFFSLATPQLRGSRSDRGRDANAPSPTPRNNGSNSGGSSTPASSPSGSGAAGSGSSQSGSNTSDAFKSATSRFGAPLRGSVQSRASAASQNAPSAAMGPNGIGNSADNLPGSGPGAGGGGGGNGPGDFMLVLQEVVKPGTRVKKGDVVAEFDRQYMLNRLDDYRAAVTQSEADLKKQKANLDITRKAHEQLITSAKGALEKARLDMKTIPVLSEIDAERTKLALDEAEARYQQLLKEVKFVQISQDADIRNAELQLEQSKLELKRAEMNADKMIAKAPIDGLTVMQSMFRGGDFGQIQQGDQLWPGMFYMQIVDPSSMIINASVNQVDADELKLGQKATVHFDAYPGLELPAHVVSIAAVTKSGGFRASFVKEVPVRLKIDKMDRRVIPDLSVSADVVIGSDERAAAVAPAASVFREGSLAKPFVYVQEALGWRRRDVELGLANNLAVAIKNGLRPGEVVALDRPQSLEENP